MLNAKSSEYFPSPYLPPSIPPGGGAAPTEPAPTLEEVEKALKYTRDGKAAGPDDIPIELVRTVG